MLRKSYPDFSREHILIAHRAGLTSTSKKNRTYTEKQFYQKRWTFLDSTPEILAAGYYEYPFDVVLEGSLPESVEGLPDSHIIYRFKAEIGRKYSKDYTIYKPLRIVRTLDSDALELSHAMVGYSHHLRKTVV